MSNNFKIIKKDDNSRARLGVLITPHGLIKTPSYVFVGTYGKFLHLSPSDLKKAKIQIIIANTFHLWQEALAAQRAPSNTRSNKSFLLNKLGAKIPTMTDSGGFQVLSLAFSDKNKIGKFMNNNTKKDEIFKRKRVKITSKGVHFNFKGDLLNQRIEKTFLGPELSMNIQNKIGADIIFAFDHITSPLDNFEYNKKAVDMTSQWARICLREHAKNARFRQSSGQARQMLFGIVQGGIYKKLREKSAKYIGSLPFDGFGIGGSYTKKQISKTLKWMIPYLPEEKPRHLLGVGKVADIFEAIENGVDLFDCVIPTREARHGRLYTKTGHIDIRKGKYSNDQKIIERECGCPTCKQKIPRSQINKALKDQPSHLINEICNCRRQSLTRCRGQRWCLLHNIWFFNHLVEKIRNSIQKGKFLEFKNKYLKNFKN